MLSKAEDDKKHKATAKALEKLDISAFQYHKMTVDQMLKELKTNLETGLSTKEAEERLKQYGSNELEKEEETSLWVRIKESFDDLLVRILLLAATVSFIIALTGMFS